MYNSLILTEGTGFNVTIPFSEIRFFIRSILKLGGESTPSLKLASSPIVLCELSMLITLSKTT